MFSQTRPGQRVAESCASLWPDSGCGRSGYSIEGSYREHFDARADTGIEMISAGARLATNREVGQLLAAKKAAWLHSR